MAPSQLLDTLPLEFASSKRQPLVIAGPCSAESREQCMRTARALLDQGQIDVFRAGVWKPRTRPNSFEGVGEQALPWLAEIQQELHIPVATEVANYKHVEACLKHGIRLLWIGARTTANPFSVQEIADALQGEDVTILVKNPIHPDIHLWIGALERFNHAGVRRLAAVHRGFAAEGEPHYRYPPKWSIPIELKRRYPELPLFCDPSHICGSTNHLHAVAQKAMDLNMDGVMIEAHIDPKNALSDAAQQIHPTQLDALINTLALRKPSSSDPLFDATLQTLRSQIDEIDTKLIETLRQRFQVVKKIGAYKGEHDITILQLERWKEILSSRSAMGIEFNIDPLFVRQLLELIHQESIRIQTAIMNNPTDSTAHESFHSEEKDLL